MLQDGYGEINLDQMTPQQGMLRLVRRVAAAVRPPPQSRTCFRSRQYLSCLSPSPVAIGRLSRCSPRAGTARGDRWRRQGEHGTLLRCAAAGISLCFQRHLEPERAGSGAHLPRMGDWQDNPDTNCGCFQVCQGGSGNRRFLQKYEPFVPAIPRSRGSIAPRLARVPPPRLSQRWSPARSLRVGC